MSIKNTREQIGFGAKFYPTNQNDSAMAQKKTQL
jgi:hypothetical protein